VSASAVAACHSRPLPAAASTAELASFLVEEARVPAISYAVLDAGQLAAADAFGLADAKDGARVDRASLFEAASLTKPVIATLAMRLFDAGLFELDEPVARVVEAPRIRDRKNYARVTPRHLLSHSSGLPNWSGDPLDRDRNDALGFDFAPGEGFSYSGEGYGLLQDFLEAKSGRRIEELAQDYFAELGMQRSALAAASAGGTTVRGHWGFAPSRMARRTEASIAALSLLSNADDYARFLQDALSGAGVSPETLREFRKRHVTIESSQELGRNYILGWSLGWGVLEGPEGSSYFQWGDNGPFRAFAAFSPSSQDGLVYFVNGSDGLLYADALTRPVLGDLSPAIGWFNHPLLEKLRKIIRL